jgi:hypothetical protein
MRPDGHRPVDEHIVAIRPERIENLRGNRFVGLYVPLVADETCAMMASSRFWRYAITSTAAPAFIRSTVPAVASARFAGR